MAWTFVDWEDRPAVTDGSTAFAILAPGEGWTEVDSAEVGDSGGVVSEADFNDRFGDLPELPNSKRQASPAASAAAG